MVKRIFWIISAIAFVGAGAVGGATLANSYIKALNTNSLPWIRGSAKAPAGVPDTWQTAAVAAFAILGVLVGFLVWTLVSSEIRRLRRVFDSMSPQDKIAGLLGILIGFVLTVLIIASFHPPTLVGLLIALILCYLGMAFVFSMREQIRLYFPSAVPSGKQTAATFIRPKILDTNVIIDGRIADICKAGFVEGLIYIPRFVLDELQQIADSSDPLKRARGRRGLDILNAMQQEMSLQIQTYDVGNGNGNYPEEVDGKLVELAKEINGALVTNDYNLNKVAGLHGVRVLNVNELANALKPVVLPGEEMSILVIKDGKESSQGVGYLDDGTMVVVEGARRHIGDTVDVIVTSVLQTAAGKMIFANLRDDQEEEEIPVDENSRYYPGSRPRKKIR